MRMIVIALVILLAGCAEMEMMQKAEKDTLYKRESVAISAEEAAGKISPVEAARRRNAAGEAIYGSPSPAWRELAAYRVYLAEKIEKNEITTTEAEYAFSQKVSDLADRENAMILQQQQAAAALIGAMPRHEPFQLPMPQAPAPLPRAPTVNCSSVAVGNTLQTHCQ